MKRHLAIILLAASIGSPCPVHAAPIKPGDNLVTQQLPEIDDAIIAETRAYTDFAPKAFVAWHPKKSEMLIAQRASSGSTQLFSLAAPGATPSQLTDFKEPVRTASFEPTKGDYLMFAKDTGGNEVFQLYKLTLATGVSSELTPPTRRAGSLTWRKDGQQIAYTSTTLDKENKATLADNQEAKATTEIRLMNPLAPETDRAVARFEGGRIFRLAFSPDGRELLYTEFFANDNTRLWVLNLATGAKRQLAKPPRITGDGADVDSGFAANGRTIWSASNAGREFKNLSAIELKTAKRRFYLETILWDVERVAPQPVRDDAGPLALVTNENGVSKLRLFDAHQLKPLPTPELALPPGVITGLTWSPTGSTLGFANASAKSPGEVYAYEWATRTLTQWTMPVAKGDAASALDPNTFAEPQVIRWSSFDRLEITGLYYPAPSTFSGKRPVIINIHGGPEAQSRAGFIGRNNYYLNQLGVAMIYPNVRGSIGFGRRFAKLDNGFKREDSVKDIGALLDWIGQQPELDQERVIVMGGSYGGYMSLAIATHYPERIAGSVDSVGISHFVTFLKNTESYRRDLRRVEYGDERDPTMHDFLHRISPLTNAHKIKKPLFVVQGKNDPRVPYTEALQIVEQAQKNGAPVWFLMANDEGHGFAKKKNADFLFYASVAFVRQVANLQ